MATEGVMMSWSGLLHCIALATPQGTGGRNLSTFIFCSSTIVFLMVPTLCHFPYLFLEYMELLVQGFNGQG